jgi:hypothetical protein
METNMIRYRFFLNFDKEEAWLNEMARQGWELTGVGLGYQFRAAEPQPAEIRIDFRVFASQDKFIDYITMFEDSGWQHVAGSKNKGVQYFKRMSAGSSEDIFSDALSRAERYKRLSNLWFSMAVVFLLLLATLGITGAADLRALVQPARFYLTPGLWERTGAAFWQAFWFETPFSLFRAVLLYSFPFSLACYLIFALKSYRLFNKEKNHVTAA